MYPSSSMMLTHLPPAVTEFLSNASMDEKKHLLSILSDDIAKELATVDNQVSDTPKTPIHIADFVEHVEDLEIDEDLSAGVLEELESLKLKSRSSKGKNAKVKTQWLSPSDEPYNYGSIINKPKPIGDYPFICKLMKIVNSHASTSGDMMAALVSCMSTPKTTLSLHADDEPLIAQDSSIATVSFGPERTLEFAWKTTKANKNGHTPTDFSLPAKNLSMNVMRPGCQLKIKHRVPAGTTTGARYSISFRRIVPPTPEEIMVPPTSEESILKSSKLDKTPSNSPPKKKVVLMAGDSFYERLDVTRLSKGRQTVVKVSKGGRKIDDVYNAMLEYVKKNPDEEVKTLFISVGTNDIRYCKTGINHLKSLLCNFLKSTKQLFPMAKIYIQSLLPIPSNGCPYSERNIVEMNNLLYNLCSRYKIFYLDAFSYFLNRFGYRDSTLFPAFDPIRGIFDIHPNSKGMGVLALIYIRRIHSRWFNPLGY